MSFKQQPRTYSIYLPFLLFITATLFIWQLWGKKSTLLVLTLLLTIIFIQDQIKARTDADADASRDQ